LCTGNDGFLRRVPRAKKENSAIRCDAPAGRRCEANIKSRRHPEDAGCALPDDGARG